MKKNQKIILITGTPAVGKTTISRLLARKLDALHIDLGELVKQENLTLGIDEERGTLIADVDKLTERVQEILEKTEKDAIIDGHYATDIIRQENVNYVFVLRRSPDELQKTMETRGFKQQKIRENLEAEILDVCLSDALAFCNSKKVCEIDTTNKKPVEVVEEIIQTLNGKKQCKTGIVDWLGKLEAEGRLQEFLKEP
jgi:adenylate kinase